jgi:hypothetical protein
MITESIAKQQTASEEECEEVKDNKSAEQNLKLKCTTLFEYFCQDYMPKFF